MISIEKSEFSFWVKINLNEIHYGDFNILEYESIIQELESLSKPENVKGMARFGINSKKVYGIKCLNCVI